AAQAHDAQAARHTARACGAGAPAHPMIFSCRLHTSRGRYSRHMLEALMARPARIAIDHVTAPYAALLLRVTLGVVYVAHGLLKALVLTLPGTAAFFVEHGFPGWIAYPVFLAEVLGGAALIAGFQTRLTALALTPVVLGAFTVDWPIGWYFVAPHGAWEYIAVLLAALLFQ